MSNLWMSHESFVSHLSLKQKRLCDVIVTRDTSEQRCFSDAQQVAADIFCPCRKVSTSLEQSSRNETHFRREVGTDLCSACSFACWNISAHSTSTGTKLSPPALPCGHCRVSASLKTHPKRSCTIRRWCMEPSNWSIKIWLGSTKRNGLSVLFQGLPPGSSSEQSGVLLTKPFNTDATDSRQKLQLHCITHPAGSVGLRGVEHLCSRTNMQHFLNASVEPCFVSFISSTCNWHKLTSCWCSQTKKSEQKISMTNCNAFWQSWQNLLCHWHPTAMKIWTPQTSMLIDCFRNHLAPGPTCCLTPGPTCWPASLTCFNCRCVCVRVCVSLCACLSQKHGFTNDRVGVNDSCRARGSQSCCSCSIGSVWQHLLDESSLPAPAGCC